MKRTSWVLPSALVFAVSSFVAPPVQAATITVVVENLAFQGGPRVVAQGTTVTWQFNQGPHTTTSSQGFWGSPISYSGDVFTRKFNQAGTFEYFCDIHGHHQMHSSIAVRLRTAALPGGKRIRWSSAALAGVNYDVQFRRAGATKWRTFRSSTTALTGDFKPARKGRFQFRALTRNLDNNQVSGWSPTKRVRIL